MNHFGTFLAAAVAITGQHGDMGTLLLTLAWSAMLVQPQNVKPACNAARAGQFWPATAESDVAAQRRLAQAGELEVCGIHKRRYRWQPVTVNVHKLVTTRK